MQQMMSSLQKQHRAASESDAVRVRRSVYMRAVNTNLRQDFSLSCLIALVQKI